MANKHLFTASLAIVTCKLKQHDTISHLWDCPKPDTDWNSLNAILKIWGNGDHHTLLVGVNIGVASLAISTETGEVRTPQFRGPMWEHPAKRDSHVFAQRGTALPRAASLMTARNQKRFSAEEGRKRSCGIPHRRAKEWTCYKGINLSWSQQCLVKTGRWIMIAYKTLFIHRV